MDAVTVADHAATGRQRSLAGAFALALIAEATIVASLLLWLRDRPPVTAIDKPSMEISLVTLPPEPKPAEPPPTEPSLPVPTPPPPAPPVAAQPPPPEPVPQPRPEPPAKPALRRPKHVPKIVKPVEAPPAAAAAVQYPPQPEPPRPAARVENPPAPARTADFDSKVRAAIEAAVAFPFAAQALHQYGQARVEFDYLDGRANGIRLVQSSGFPLLDPAALAAVRAAHYPPPPPEAQGRALHYVLWVRFQPKTAP